MRDLIEHSLNNKIDISYYWGKLRVVLVDLFNKKVVLEPNSDFMSLYSEIKVLPAYESQKIDIYILKLFPYLRHEYHFDDNQKEKPKINIVYPPKNPLPHSARNIIRKSIEYSKTNVSSIKNTGDKETSNDSLDIYGFLNSRIKQSNNLQLKFGKNNNNDPYSFSSIPDVSKESTFYSLTSRGIIKANDDGNSEFLSFEQFLKNKTEYKILKPIQFFSHFPVFKSFYRWKYMTRTFLFKKKRRSFFDSSWQSKFPLPDAITEFRKHLIPIQDCLFFPIQKSDIIEYDYLKESMFDRAVLVTNIVGEQSSIIQNLLFDLVAAISEEYAFISSPEFVDYFASPKIPADALAGSKLPFKKGLSIVETREKRINHEREIEKCKQKIEMLHPFLTMCDKSILEIFLTMFRQQMMDFSKIFSTKDRGFSLRVFLVYENDDLHFLPSFEDLVKLFDQHISQLVKAFHFFVRPALVDTKEPRKYLQSNENIRPFKDIIFNDKEFRTSYEFIIESLQKSYSDAANTLSMFGKTSKSVFRFYNKWPLLKNETNHSIFIKYLSKLSKYQDTVSSFKMNYQHFLISLDSRDLRQKLNDSLSIMISENNSNLFRNFKGICSSLLFELSQHNMTLNKEGISLDILAELNDSVQKAQGFMVVLNEKIVIVNNIFHRAQQIGDLIVPKLLTDLEEVRVSKSIFEQSLIKAEKRMSDYRSSILAQMLNRNQVIDERIASFERQMKHQFSSSSNMKPSLIISDIEKTLENIKIVHEDIKFFDNLASRLKYTKYDFSGLFRIENELQSSLSNWKKYQLFLDRYNTLTESKLIGFNIPEVLTFTNEYENMDLKSLSEVQAERISILLSRLSNFIPFFTLLTKIEMNEERWKGFAESIGVTYFEIKEISIRNFLQLNILGHIDSAKSFIMTLQQREDLKISFENMIEELTNTTFKFTLSSITKSMILTFPSIHEAIFICERFITELSSLSNSPYYYTVEKQVTFWIKKLDFLSIILNLLLECQKDLVFLNTAARAMFSPKHIPQESQRIRYIDLFYKQLMTDLENDPRIISLIPPTQNCDNSKGNEIPNGYLDSSPIDQVTIEYDPPCTDIDSPLFNANQKVLRGDFLIKCLREVQHRCQILLISVSYLIDQYRQGFSRFYFCSNDEVIRIILACSNLRYLNNDLKPIFPSLSKFHISIADTQRVMGVLNTIGETYQFSKDFDVDRLNIIELLHKTEEELNFSVRASILDASSSREYADFHKWINRHPVQSLIIAESVYFASSVADILLRGGFSHEWIMLTEKCNDVITKIRNEMDINMDKYPSYCTYIALKIRHREIIKDIMNLKDSSMNNPAIRKHFYHVIVNSKGFDYVGAQIGHHLINYGYEMIADFDFIPLTDSEEQAYIGLASCLSNPEMMFCQQIGGERRLMKSFADIIGYPFFGITQTTIPNLFSVISSMKAVLIIEEVFGFPESFYNFFSSLEKKLKIMRTGTHYASIDSQNSKFLVCFGSTSIPTWLSQRIRPIHVSNISKVSALDLLSKIHDFSVMGSPFPLSFISKAIRYPSYKKILNNGLIHHESLSTKHKFFFDLGEFYLSKRLELFEEPIVFQIPERVNNKIMSLNDILQRIEGFLSRSQAQELPILQIIEPLSLVSSSFMDAEMIFLAAIKQEICHSRISLYDLTKDRENKTIFCFKPLILSISKEYKLDNITAIHCPSLTLNEIVEIILQNKSFAPFINEIKPHTDRIITSFVDNDQAYYKILSKLNLIRYIFKTNQSIPMYALAESVFTEKYHLISMKQEEIYLKYFSLKYPVVIEGTNSYESCSMAKALLAKHIKANDTIVYSSPYNNNISSDIFNYLSLYTRGVYVPNYKGSLYICIFDFHFATPHVFNFVMSLFKHNCIFNPNMNCYCPVKNVHMILTSNDTIDFYSLRVPFFKIKASMPDEYIIPIPQHSLFEDHIVNWIIKEILCIDNSLLILSFIKAINPITNIDDLICVFDLYFGSSKAVELCKMLSIDSSVIIALKNRNFNLANTMVEFNIVSRISEVIKHHLNAIFVGNLVTCFSYIQNVEFIVFSTCFMNQLCSYFLKVYQNKLRTVFLLDLDVLNPIEVYDFLYFFLYQSDSPEASTFFIQSDMRLLKNYIKPGESFKSFLSDLMSNVSFILMTNDSNSIPQNILNSFVIIKPDYEIGNSLVHISNPFVDIIAPYLTIDTMTFEKLTKAFSDTFRERFQDFIQEIQLIVQFFTNLTSLQHKVQHKESIFFEEPSLDLTQRVEQLELKLKDLEKKAEELEEQKKLLTIELQSIHQKLSIKIPQEIAAINASLSTFTFEMQVEQIEQWLDSKDDYSQFTNIFKDLFGFISTSHFIEMSTSPSFCKLFASIKQFSIVDINPAISQKLSRYNFEDDSPLASLLRQMQAESFRSKSLLPTLSKIPIVNTCISWLSYLVMYYHFQDMRGSVSAELTQISNKTVLNHTHITQLKQQYEESQRALKQKANIVECPQWLMNAWEKDQMEVRKLFDLLDNGTRAILEIVGESSDSEKLIEAMSALFVGYRFGICSLCIEERHILLERLKLSHLISPFDAFERGVDAQMYFPFKNMISLFTLCTTNSLGQSSLLLSNNTTHVFQSSILFDQFIFLRTLPLKPLFYTEKQEETPQTITFPLIIYFDPHDITFQTLITSYPNCKVCFSSSHYSDIIMSAISSGHTLILHLDDIQSGRKSIDFVLYCALQINATRQIMHNDQIRPVNSQFRLFIVTNIKPDDFGLDKNTILFADMSVKSLEITKWFEFATIFSSNTKMESHFIDVLVRLTNRMTNFFLCLHRIADLSHDSWPMYFENPVKLLSLKSLVDSLVNHRRTFVETLDQMKTILSPTFDDQSSLILFNQFVSQCRALVNDYPGANSCSQLINSIHLFVSSCEEKLLTHKTSLYKFEYIAVHFLNCIPSKDRIPALSQFEALHLSGVVTSSSLLFESSFPKLHERPIAPVFPQLVSCICHGMTDISPMSFTYNSPETIPQPVQMSIIIIIDKLIPVDFYSHNLASSRKEPVITIGSFSLDVINTPTSVYRLIDSCLSSSTSMIIVYDESLPAFFIPSLVYYSHIKHFCQYYIVLTELLSNSLPAIPKSMIIRVSKPFTLSGWNYLVDKFPGYCAETLHFEAPMFYFLLLLSHRSDFPLQLQFLIPFSASSRLLFSEGDFSDQNQRILWNFLLSEEIETFISDPITKLCYRGLLDYFFRANVPSIPDNGLVDFKNDTIYHAEIPPSTQSVGMMINYGEPLLTIRHGWRSKLPDRFFFQIGDNSKCIMRISGATIINGYWNQNEITIIGKKTVNVCIVEIEPAKGQYDIPIGIYDGDDFLGITYAKCSGNREIWQLAGIRVFLP